MTYFQEIGKESEIVVFPYAKNPSISLARVLDLSPTRSNDLELVEESQRVRIPLDAFGGSKCSADGNER